MLPLVITVAQTDGGTRRYAFADSPVSIGRSPFAELQLSEPFISRWEGTLRFDAKEITFFSLGSTNATYVNGKPLAKCEDDVPLSVHSVLTLGDLELRFSREPVPESDLRRRGKRRPTRDDAEAGAKTQYLDANTLAQPRPDRAASALAATSVALLPSKPARAIRAVASSAVASSAVASSAVASSAPAAPSGEASVPPLGEVVTPAAATIAPQPCRVLGAAPFMTPAVKTASRLSETARDGDPRAAARAPERRATLSLPVALGGASAAHVEEGSAALHHSYREARAALLADLRARLEPLSGAERAQYLTALIRREPTLASDPDLQLELHAAGVLSPTEIPELRAWLRAMSPATFPADLQLNSQLALTRVLGLVEVLTQSLAEIHEAQESVRRRWLGRSARRSIFQSDNAYVVLAYLLNPQADWNERLRELHESVRDVVTHELALFRATFEGARTLVNTLAPEAVAASAAADGGGAGGAERAPGFWTRLLCKDAGDIGLWRRFLSIHDELTDGARYERIFLGRAFSRSYLAAMGQPDPARG